MTGHAHVHGGVERPAGGNHTSSSRARALRRRAARRGVAGASTDCGWIRATVPVGPASSQAASRNSAAVSVYGPHAVTEPLARRRRPARPAGGAGAELAEERWVADHDVERGPAESSSSASATTRCPRGGRTAAQSESATSVVATASGSMSAPHSAADDVGRGARRSGEPLRRGEQQRTAAARRVAHERAVVTAERPLGERAASDAGRVVGTVAAGAGRRRARARAGRPAPGLAPRGSTAGRPPASRHRSGRRAASTPRSSGDLGGARPRPPALSGRSPSTVPMPQDSTGAFGPSARRPRRRKHRGRPSPARYASRHVPSGRSAGTTTVCSAGSGTPMRRAGPLLVSRDGHRLRATDRSQYQRASPAAVDPLVEGRARAPRCRQPSADRRTASRWPRASDATAGPHLDRAATRDRGTACHVPARCTRSLRRGRAGRAEGG